jgi:Amt family ammonium transporter
LNHFSPLRVSEEDEVIGLNIAEHGVESEIDELCHQMEEQTNSGDFSQLVSVHRGTDIGLVAVRYNGVLNKMRAQHDELLQVADALNATNRDLSEAQVATEANRRVLDEKVSELESFHTLAIDREIEMIELKREINRLSHLLGEPEAFDLSFADARID